MASGQKLAVDFNGVEELSGCFEEMVHPLALCTCLVQKYQRNPPKAISPKLRMVLIARLSVSFDPKTDEHKKTSDISISGQWREPLSTSTRYGSR